MTKNKFIILSVLTSFFLVSCGLFKTQETTTTDLQRATQIAVVVKTGVSFAVAEVLTKNPKSLPYFKASALAIKTCVDANNLNPDDVIAAVQQFVPADVSGSPLIRAAVSAGLDIYKTFYNINISSGKDINVYLKMILTAIQQGIEVSTSTNAPVDQLKMPFTTNPLQLLNESNLKL